MNILVLSFFPAFTPVTSGGEARLNGLYSSLSSKFNIVLLSSTHYNGIKETVCHGRHFIERRIPKDSFFAKEWKALSSYSSGADMSAPVLAASAKYHTSFHDAYLEEYEKADLIIHESPFTIGYDIFRYSDNKIRIYNSYNCESVLYKQIHACNKSSPIWEIVHDCEHEMLECSDMLFYCSPEDLAQMRSTFPDVHIKQTMFVPHGISPEKICDCSSTQKHKYMAIFMGSQHSPNVDAAKYILHELAPRLPDIEFNIIGSCMSKGQPAPNVVCHGRLDEETKRKLLSKADLALNPMINGSGANVKMLDYMAHGLVVLSTPFGVRGITRAQKNVHYLEANIDDFYDRLLIYISNHEKYVEIGVQARILIEKYYSWPAISKLISNKLFAIQKEKCAHSENSMVLVLNDYNSFTAVGGGGVRTRGLYSNFPKSCRISFLCFSTDDLFTINKYTDQITIFSIPKTREHKEDEERNDKNYHIAITDIAAIKHSLKNNLLCKIYSVLQKKSRYIICEHCYMGNLPLAYGNKFIYSSQNHETRLKSYMHGNNPIKNELLPAVEKLENQLLANAEFTIAVSREDAESFQNGKYSGGAIFVIPNGASIPLLAHTGNVEENKEFYKRAAVFIGSTHFPNVEAVHFIVNNLAPKMKDVKFHIIGNICNLFKIVPKNVILWGEVDEESKTRVLSSCALALNPMMSGGGSNIKMADFLAHGLHILSTTIGLRGHKIILDNGFATAAELNDFPEQILKFFENVHLSSQSMRKKRILFFEENYSFNNLSKKFYNYLNTQVIPKIKVLFVTYRFIFPAIGGAEMHLEKFIRAMAKSNKFEIDVISTDTQEIKDINNFCTNYFTQKTGKSLIDVPNVKYRRFPIDEFSISKNETALKEAFLVEIDFEKELAMKLQDIYAEKSGIAWGVAYPQHGKDGVTRWSYVNCGFYLAKACSLKISAYSPNNVVITVLQNNKIIMNSHEFTGSFVLNLECENGFCELDITTSSHATDVRPLGFLLTQLSVDGQPISLEDQTLPQQALSNLCFEEIIEILNECAQNTRYANNIRMTDFRGPHSNTMEKFIQDNIKKYDLLLTHNNVFKTAVYSLKVARSNNVPSILIPHAHLDDRFYHFPDFLESCKNADLLLSCPACVNDFLNRHGCKSIYLGAGCDAIEYRDEDVKEFRKMYKKDLPFFLVLGRKSISKQYDVVISAVDKLNFMGIRVHCVLIGHDDDNRPITSENATYLGYQQKSVVYGAIKSCIALCNMSTSESFGMVLLESWLARRPVVVNKRCAAFHDLVKEGENGLYADENNLPSVLEKLIMNQQYCDSLGNRGFETARNYSWDSITNKFIEFAFKLSSKNLK